MLLTVEDNGDGMTAEQIDMILNKKVKDRKHFNGIGIPNVRERIQLFFGEEYGLTYESKTGSYTRAVFTLPVICSEEEMKKTKALMIKMGEECSVEDKADIGR